MSDNCCCNKDFDVIAYMSGMTGFVFDKDVLSRIALERGVFYVTSFDEITAKQKDLILADLLYTAYLSPNVWASAGHAHGSFSKQVGQQSIFNDTKSDLIDTAYGLYKKHEDPMAEMLSSSSGFAEFIPLERF